MFAEKIKLSKKEADGYVIPMGSFSIVFARTDTGMVGCGLFDVSVFDKFTYPAVRVKAKAGLIATIEDLLDAEVIMLNKSAEKRGIAAGMTGKDALERL